MGSIQGGNMKIGDLVRYNDWYRGLIGRITEIHSTLVVVVWFNESIVSCEKIRHLKVIHENR